MAKTKTVQTKTDGKSATKSRGVKADAARVKPAKLKAKPPVTAFADLAAVLKAKKAGRLPKGFTLVVDNDSVSACAKDVSVSFNVGPRDFIFAAAKLAGLKAVSV